MGQDGHACLANQCHILLVSVRVRRFEEHDATSEAYTDVFLRASTVATSFFKRLGDQRRRTAVFRATKQSFRTF